MESTETTIGNVGIADVSITLSIGNINIYVHLMGINNRQRNINVISPISGKGLVQFNDNNGFISNPCGNISMMANSDGHSNNKVFV